MLTKEIKAKEDAGIPASELKKDKRKLKDLKKYLKSANIQDEENWRLRALLNRLGLTKYESEAYIGLVQGGNAMLDLFKKSMLTGIGLALKTWDEVEALGKELEEKERIRT